MDQLLPLLFLVKISHLHYCPALLQVPRNEPSVPRGLL